MLQAHILCRMVLGRFLSEMLARTAGWIVLLIVLSAALTGGANALDTRGGGFFVGASAPPIHLVDAERDTIFVARMQPVLITENRTLAGRTDPIVVTADQPQGGQKVSEATGRHASPRSERSSENLSVGGFVMNETFSVIGSDFYTAFYSAWSEPEGAEMYTVNVHEEPAPQFGARLRVEISDTVIFQTFLRPNNQKIQQAAEQAVQRAQLYIEKYHEPRENY